MTYLLCLPYPNVDFKNLILYEEVTGLQAEQAVIENIVRQRRTSILPPSQQQQQQLLPGLGMSSSAGANPHILVSEASVNDFKDPSLFCASLSRRPSAVSIGPALVPVSRCLDHRDHSIGLFN